MLTSFTWTWLASFIQSMRLLLLHDKGDTVCCTIVAHVTSLFHNALTTRTKLPQHISCVSSFESFEVQLKTHLFSLPFSPTKTATTTGLSLFYFLLYCILPGCIYVVYWLLWYTLSSYVLLNRCCFKYAIEINFDLTWPFVRTLSFLACSIAWSADARAKYASFCL